MSEQGIHTEISDDGRTTTLKVSGAFSIEVAAEFRNALSGAMEQSEEILFDVSGLEAIDITALQLLCSGCRSAASKGKVFAAAGAIPEVMRSFVETAGVTRTSACRHNNNQICIWFGGKD